MSIASYSTFRRWVRRQEEGALTATKKQKVKKSNRKPGRPKTPEDIRDTIIRNRKETGFGYTKILQELRRMGVHISRQTVKNGIVEAGFPTTPGDHPDTWHKFLKRHAETLWQCDFACKKKWTIKGLVDLYFIVFIHLGSRRIWLSPCTENPTGDWTVQQARNFSMWMEDEGLECTHMMRDRDKKYTESFDGVFTSADCKIKKTPIRSPNLQAHVERLIQTIKHEVLNAFCIVTNAHLDHLLKQTPIWYNTEHCHSARDHLPPQRSGDPPATVEFHKNDVVCTERLGGHIKSYSQAASTIGPGATAIT
ncbi:Integrase core domain protein [Planctomycetes bacterium CA13]|uniref:Integrase core domain protein n=1 Tax=Novipirellula herctigrandis TaxID=2527986 RepID=A0A5C5ZB02_9BACT|nr:Integrase core domain protein [Planctomycetes bacterium CA13]